MLRFVYVAQFFKHLSGGNGMLRLGKKLRRFTQESVQKGQAAVQEVLKTVQLSEEECNKPFKHKESLAKKRKNAEEIDIIDLWEHFMGSVRQTCFHETDWREIQQTMKNADLKHETPDDSHIYKCLFARRET